MAVPGGVKAVERFDERFDRLCERFYRTLRFGLIKSSAFLNFRIFRKPAVRYGVYAKLGGDGQPEGYIVLKKFHDPEQGVDRCHIVDIVALDYAIFRSLVDCAHSIYGDCAEINLLQPERSVHQDFLLQNGFRRGSKYNQDENLIFFAPTMRRSDSPKTRGTMSLRMTRAGSGLRRFVGDRRGEPLSGKCARL